VYNVFSAIKVGEVFGAPKEALQSGVEKLKIIRGRVEHIFEGQPFTVVVDYAHTTDSLEKLYRTFRDKEKVCVLGSTGGGRDTWKRPEMAKVAEKYCSKIILTDEDPYDEDPKKIIEEMASGMKTRPTIIMNRREAIRKAFEVVDDDGVVLITGKGTDPYIMRANGKKEPWSDADVSREELKNILNK
jgi:UDP-N-acetylmuramoyl-L-alanyl-D-glutamate--2,6-diaminopimelate ligase